MIIFGKNIPRYLLVQIIIPILFSITILIVGYMVTRPATKKLLIEERKLMVREMVNGVCNLISSYEIKNEKGEISKEQAQSMIIQYVQNLRYGKEQLNYFWIQDLQGNFIYHPFLVGSFPPDKHLLSLMKGISHQIATKINETDECYLTYTWYHNKNDVIGVQKQSFAKKNKNWNWIICTGFLLSDIDTELKLLTKKVLLTLFILLGGMVFILAFVLFRNYKNIKKITVADQELTKSEFLFKGFADNVDYGLLIFENDLPVFANPHFYKVFEISENLIQNFSILNYLPGWEKERVSLAFKNSNHETVTKLNCWLRLPDNKEKYISLKIINNQELIVKTTYLLVKDITEEKKTQTSLEILTENFVRVPDAIVITDLSGNIEYVNPGFEKNTGYTLEEVMGQNPRILSSGKTPSYIYEDLWKTITSGNIWKGEFLNKKKDGTLYWESTQIFPIKNKQNEIIKYSSIKSDITQLKGIQQELLNARNKAEESDRYKNAFLNNVSHEVRTPLNAIYGFSQVVRSNTNPTDNTYPYLNIIEQNCQTLIKLFEDILDISSIESKSVQIMREDVLVKDLLLRLVSKYNVQLAINEERAVEILVDEDNNFETMVMYTDRKRFNQVLDKLLSNAVKFTPRGSIKISYTILTENIIFYISDTGVGIPEKERGEIFKAFSHGDNMYVSLHKGVGLGLNIAKLLTELLGGNISFSSEEGIGTIFKLTFPTIYLKNYKLNGNTIDSYENAIKDKSILIAEDNDESFTQLENILTPQNKILRAHSGTEAISIIENYPLPDLILMDLLMPEMDGITATRIIRNLTSKLTIIAFISVNYNLTDEESELFDGKIHKPVSSRELLNCIKTLL